MHFTHIQDHEVIRSSARRVQSLLLQAQTALRAGHSDNAEERVQDALNQLINVIQHLQFSYSVPHIRQPDHTPVLMWLDRHTLVRLENLQSISGYSLHQVIFDLMQSGKLDEEYHRREPDPEG